MNDDMNMPYEPEDKQDRIDRYVRHEMTEAESEAFGQEMAADADLADTVDTTLMVVDELKERERKKESLAQWRYTYELYRQKLEEMENDDPRVASARSEFRGVSAVSPRFCEERCRPAPRKSRKWLWIAVSVVVAACLVAGFLIFRSGNPGGKTPAPAGIRHHDNECVPMTPPDTTESSFRNDQPESDDDSLRQKQMKPDIGGKR